MPVGSLPAGGHLKSASDVEEEITKKRHPYPKGPDGPLAQTMYKQSSGGSRNMGYDQTMD